jgi:hypothetical protein
VRQDHHHPFKCLGRDGLLRNSTPSLRGAERRGNLVDILLFAIVEKERLPIIYLMK